MSRVPASLPVEKTCEHTPSVISSNRSQTSVNVQRRNIETEKAKQKIEQREIERLLNMEHELQEAKTIVKNSNAEYP